jgi:cytochrome c oxidase accessory protein FixG
VAGAAGDCVDCGLCVTTCPTGIDIRDGLQMECINCAQCIDACDAVMTKLKRPKGLIRYSSQAAVGGEKWRLLRPRVVIYPAILLVIGTLFLIVLASQVAADVTVLRGLGKPFNEMPGGEIANQVRIKIVNRTDHAHTYTIASGERGVRIVSETDPIRIEGGKSATIAAEVIVPGSAIVGGWHTATLRIADDAGFTRDVQYRVLGPGTLHHAESAAEAQVGREKHEQEHVR